jgi:hypothetical protein
MRVRPIQRLVALAPPGALLLALGLRFSLLQRYASDLPFHDQWDAEGLHLLRPWKAGADVTPFLFRFHNEHHPVLTKLIALGFAAFDGMWSALPQLLLNTLFQGIIVLLVARVARRLLPPRAAWLVAVLAAVALSLPLLWENLLWGFQSQFYLAILLGLLHLDLTWSIPRLGWRWVLGACVGILTLGTFAAGFLSVLASGLVALSRLARAGPTRRHALATLAVAAAVAAVGIHSINPVPYPAVARTAFSALEAWFVLGSWPFGAGAAVFLIQLPALALIFGQGLRGGERPSQPWLVALVLWLAAVTAAFAFGRAELINGATPRYCDFLTVQCLVGLICLLQLASVQSLRRRIAWGVAGVWLGATAFGFVLELRTVGANDELAGRAALQAAQQKLVRTFVLTDDPGVLDSSRPSRLIHESAEQRIALLRDPGLRSLLPPSVRAPLAVPAGAGSRNVARRPFAAADLVSPGWSVTPDSTHDAFFLSEWVKPEPFPLLRFRVSGGIDGKTHRLRLLVGPAARPLAPLAETHGDTGQYINFPMPNETFRVEAAAETGSLPLDFSEPVSFSRLSWLSGKIFSSHLYFTLAGVFLLVLGGVGAWRSESIAVAEGARPAAPGRFRALAATVALVLLSASVAGWPHPFTFGAAARERVLVDPTAWSAHAVTGFQMSAVGPDAGPTASGLVYNTVPSPGAYFGTYGPGGDADTARALSTPFTLDARWLCLPVAGYPAQPANSLSIEILDDHGDATSVHRYSGVNPGERPQLWVLDVGADRGRRARVRSIDGETGHQGWLAFSTPWLLDDPAVLNSWQRLADSNRLLWLRPLLFLGGLAMGFAAFRLSRPGQAAPPRAPLLWP